MLEDLLHDFRYATRTLTRAPGFTAAAVVILALGIGANTTIFTIVSSLFLTQPTAVREPTQLVRLNVTRNSSGSGSLAYPLYQYLRDNNDVFTDVAAYDPGGIATTAVAGGFRRQAVTWLVSGNYFDVLGTPPTAGRFFRPDEYAAAGSAPVAVISYGFWQRAYGAGFEAIGSSLSLNGRSFRVVGVAAEGFVGVSPVEVPPEVWIPLKTLPLLLPTRAGLLDPVTGFGDNWLWAFARLNPGATAGEARANLDALIQRLAEDMGITSAVFGIRVTDDVRFHPPRAASLKRLMLLLGTSAAIVLAIACANIALLLLSRAGERTRELGIRTALGAGRGRVVRQLITESLLLAWLGGVAGFGLAYWTAGVAGRVLPTRLAISLAPDARVLLFTFAIATVAAVLAGMSPALKASRTDIMNALRPGTKVSSGSRFRNVLVIAQVAVSVLLVSGAGLFIRSFYTAQTLDLGFDVDRGLVLSVDLRPRGYTDAEAKQLIGALLSRLTGRPGIESASVSTYAPLGGQWGGTFVADGSHVPPDSALQSGFNTAGPGYFRTMGIPILAGREFDERDDEVGANVIIVNETFARMVWPGQSPLGKTIARDPDGPRFTVVGMARNATYYEPGEEPQAHAYFSHMQQYFRSNFTLLVRTSDDPAMHFQAVRNEISTMDAVVPVDNLFTLSDIFARVIGRYRTSAMLVGLLALLALLLAATGLYGVLSYQVAHRTRELGIRVALGAAPATVVARFVGRGLVLAAAGVAVGIVAALIGSRLVSSFLFGVQSRDALTFTVVPILLMAVAAVASFLPARRAGQVDPMVALREE